MKHSIKVKFMLLVTLIIVLIIVLQLVITQYYAMPFFMGAKSGQMEELYQKVERVLNDPKNNLSYQELQRLIMPYEENEHIWVSVWNKESGKILYSSNEKQLPLYQDNETAFHVQPQIEYRANKRTGEESLMILGRITSNDDTFLIVMDTPISAVHHSVKLIEKLNLNLAFVALLSGCILSWWFGRHFTKPILEIDKVAQAVKNLDFSLKVHDSDRKDELGTLGRNINSMSLQLADLIGQLQVANQQLELDVDHQKRIDNMRREFVANVSHELKSPLALLTMCCENLKEDIPDVDREFYCNVLTEECLRLGQLVKNMLEIASIENGITQMEFQELNFSDLIGWVCEKHRVQFNHKKILFTVDVQPDIILQGDPFYLEQAAANYLENAGVHTKEGQRIDLCVIKKEGLVRLSVFNQGEQIPEDELEWIWDSFNKSDRARTFSGESHAGLGLYIVRSIIAAHKGDCGVFNREDGVEFWFEIPI